ncbi:MAG: Glucan 1,3-beta-glucosidase 3 [Stictis urceolatum]|nr:Glucan 1,3-beta-glucosidase 3 [Stictis urceolata]
MRKFLKKTFNDISRDSNTTSDDQPTNPLGPPTENDIFRYRYQHGTNLGAIFCLERWLFGSMFEDSAPGGSELDAVKASLKAHGLPATRDKWESHWSSALSDDDLHWLSTAAHCNSIRLPIGYFTLGPNFCSDTPFEGEPSEVYVNAWAAVRSIVERCHARGVGVLLDLHAVPGGANGDEHSGTTSGKAELWDHKPHRRLANACLEFIAREAQSMRGVVGIQLCNEACHGAQDMYAWYDKVRSKIAAIDPSMPLYISDAWDLNSALEYSVSRNSTEGAGIPACPFVVDTHKYWTFGAEDTRRNPRDIIGSVPGSLDALNNLGNVCDKHGSAAVFVGEYSCVLAGSTWEQAPGDQHDGLKRDFGQAQSKTWQARASGSAFWTYRMEWMPSGEWSFRQQSDNGNITPPPGLGLSADEVRSLRDHAGAQRQGFRDAAVGGHCAYWDQQTPGGKFEHWRYEQGWDLGWGDSSAFWEARVDGVVPGERADRIGALDLWVLKRFWETGTVGEEFAWEWEQGFRKGVKDFMGAVGC